MSLDQKHAAKLFTKWSKDIKKKKKSEFWSGHHKALISILLKMDDVKRHVRARRPTVLAQLQQFCQEECAKILANYCEKNVGGYRRQHCIILGNQKKKILEHNLGFFIEVILLSLLHPSGLHCCCNNN